ncbi:MAG: hypothetical protein JHD09_13910 [Gemmataceae bacterium]|nr:hypothetical protein [Gemmataceae bacterium]
MNAGDHNSSELEITASDSWQDITIPASKLFNRTNKKPLKDWSEVGKLNFQPKTGSDLTKVLFADFKWVMESKK